MDEPCWEWMGQRNADGYGVIARWAGRRMRPAHRVLYEVMVGPVPADHVVHHVCRNRACFNPAHLKVQRREEHTDAAMNWQASKTECPQGHPYDEDNTGIVVRSNGRRSRYCRACRRAARRREGR